jgi:hypothetical protein
VLTVLVSVSLSDVDGRVGQPSATFMRLTSAQWVIAVLAWVCCHFCRAVALHLFSSRMPSLPAELWGLVDEYFGLQATFSEFVVHTSKRSAERRSRLFSCWVQLMDAGSVSSYFTRTPAEVQFVRDHVQGRLVNRGLHFMLTIVKYLWSSRGESHVFSKRVCVSRLSLRVCALVAHVQSSVVLALTHGRRLGYCVQRGSFFGFVARARWCRDWLSHVLW